MSEIGKQRLAKIRQATASRNEEIYQKYVSGMLMSQLAEEYGLSISRISAIIDYVEAKSNQS